MQKGTCFLSKIMYNFKCEEVRKQLKKKYTLTEVIFIIAFVAVVSYYYYLFIAELIRPL